TGGGRVGRRCRCAPALPRRHLPGHPADRPDPGQPLDHLGLQRLHPAVPAAPVAAQPGLLPHEHLPLREVDRAARVRARLGDAAADAPDPARALVLLRPADGADGRVPMSARRRHRLAWDVLGLLVFAVMAFPVYWMVSTAFKSGSEINSYTPTWIPTHPT